MVSKPIIKPAYRIYAIGFGGHRKIGEAIEPILKRGFEQDLAHPDIEK